MFDILVPGSARRSVDDDSLDGSCPLVFTIPDVLTAAECAEQIARLLRLGPTEAPISTTAGPVMRPDIRNNHRVMFDDHALATELFRRVEPAVPPAMCGMRPVGINERFRGYRYTRGQRFAPHYDGAFVRDAGERSLLTLIVYLNDDFDGGDTGFLDHGVIVRPRTGTALGFQHLVLHEGCEVRAGAKYALRSDVMYRAPGASRID